MNSNVLLQVDELCFLENGPYSLDLKRGEVIGIIGASGVGKSQFFRAIADLIPTRGNVFLNGTKREEYLAPQWRKSVTLVPAEPAWWFDSVMEHYSHMDSAQFQKYLKLLGFSKEVVGYNIQKMSTGERQRLGLIRALGNKPVVLLLDEPCSALDKENSNRVEDLLHQYLHNGSTAQIWVSHDREQLGRMADTCYELKSSGLQRLW